MHTSALDPLEYTLKRSPMPDSPTSDLYDVSDPLLLADTGSALMSIPTATTSTLSPDITRSHFLNPSLLRDYNLLTEQLLEDHERPQRTKVHLDVNLSVDLDLTPESYGDLQFSMLYVTVKRKPWEEDIISRDGRRIAGTVLRISDGRDQLIHRQVMGFHSFGEWWWVVRTQLIELMKRKLKDMWTDGRISAKHANTVRFTLIMTLPTVIFGFLLWRLVLS